MESARGALPDGEVLAGPAISSKGAAGKERGDITVIRNKKGTWPNLLPSGLAGEFSVPCLALRFNRCLGKRR